MSDAVRYARILVAEAQLVHAHAAAEDDDDSILMVPQSLLDSAQAAYNGLGPDVNVTPVPQADIAVLPATRHETMYEILTGGCLWCFHMLHMTGTTTIGEYDRSWFNYFNVIPNE
jgi:hypothetical protein